MRPGLGGWLLSWITTTDHKRIGILYLVTAFLFFFIGGALALAFRAQLAMPDKSVLPPELFNQAVTMHGAIMVLFFLSPLGFAFANYVVPLQIGARDMAFPRLNALSYWLYVFGGLVAASGFLVPGGAAAVGWTFYSPLTSKEFSPGLGVDLAGAGLVLLVLSATAGTINFLVTILRLRAPNMKLMDMPLFSWSILFTVLMMLIAFPALEAALLMLVADRHFGTSFFTPGAGGPVLWTHLFWFFGHPEVYIVLMPAIGAVGDIIQTFSGRPIWGKRILITAWAVVTALSMVVWVHHMFLTGVDPYLRKFMTISTELISIPFGITALCYIATLHGGRLRLKTPMLFALGAMGEFVLGGVTGVFLSSVAIDYHLRGGYWIVAHFHYTLVGGATLGLFAAVYYWYPRMTGRDYSERLGKLHFWACIVGFNLTFFPLFTALDMPRRIPTYPMNSAWLLPQQLATIGGFIFGIAQFVMILNLWRNARRGEWSGTDPWGGESKEWMPERERLRAPGPIPWAAKRPLSSLAADGGTDVGLDEAK